jgi:hypothetical protein
MKLIVSYKNIGSNWYVGVFYEMFFNFLKTFKNLEIEYISMEEMALKYNYPTTGYAGNYPSIFNPYNLIIQNIENNKTFVHSWHDFAPVMMENGTGIENFDIVLFSCVSSLTSDLYERHSKKYNIVPSFYILEYWNEHTYIEQFRHNGKINEKLFFNGGCYGIRALFNNVLQDSTYFEFKEKHSNYKDKENYYKEISEYKYVFNLDGAAKICYRDIEYFGMGIALFRDELKIMTYNPLIPNEHYFVIIDDDIKNAISDNKNRKYTIDKIESNIKYVFNNFDIDKVVKNAREWYELNTLPNNQLKIMYSFLDDFKIFK